MGIEKIISMGVILTFMAAATGQLPKAILAVHVAQLKILKESQASRWPKAALLN